MALTGVVQGPVRELINWVVTYGGLWAAEVQVCAQARQVEQSLDGRLRAGDNESMSAPGQALVCPDQDRQASTVGEVKAG